MGRLRPISRFQDKVSEIWEDATTDCPRHPARVLLDDLEQCIVTDLGFDQRDCMFYYMLEPYPESHHLQ